MWKMKDEIELEKRLKCVTIVEMVHLKFDGGGPDFQETDRIWYRRWDAVAIRDDVY